MGTNQFEEYVRAMRVLNERLAAKAAGRFAYGLPPREFACQEKLVVYASAGAQAVYVRIDDPRIAGPRELNCRQAYYKE